MMDNDNDDIMQKVQKYRALVLLYEQLDSEIDELIMAHGGGTENMPPEDVARYRQLARRRDDIQNEMLELEQQLRIDDDV